MDNLEQEKIFNKLVGFISEVIGADVVEELDINMNSKFTKDLEMDSIEIVSFAECVKKEYGDTIDFTSWLSAMGFEQLMELTVGNIVNYIVNANNTDK